MQAESGQPLDVIIQRKELERSTGSGVFYWGIGNALGESVDELVRRTPTPEVLFSVMRSKPKREDAAPSSVLLWTEYVDENGVLKPLPLHALILSRGDTKTGTKKRCYALVCYSDVPLSPLMHASVKLSHLKNVGGTRGNIGFSQVTAIVEHTSQEDEGIQYEVSLRALLRPPYFIALAGAKRLQDKDRAAIDMIVSSNPTPNEWSAFITALRNRPEYTPSETPNTFALSSE